MKYKDMQIEDIVVEFVPKSRQAIHSLLQHYKSTGNVEMVKKLKTARQLAKAVRLRIKAENIEDENTDNDTKSIG